MSSLPGIGRKTALRLVLELIRRTPQEVERFSNSFSNLREGIRYCEKCHNLSDNPLCNICASPHRDHQTICVVADIRDVMAIEGTGQYQGLYHVLGGLISPMDGIAPSDLFIDALIARVNEGHVTEIILALSASMEGETTGFYLYKKIQPAGVRVSAIARGISVGGELEYTDEITLGRSIRQRTPFESVMKK